MDTQSNPESESQPSAAKELDLLKMLKDELEAMGVEAKLDEFVEKYDCVAARRGKGLMQGLVITGRPVGEIVKKALEEGLLVISAGSDVLRLVPPLVIRKSQIDEMADILGDCLEG